MASKDSIAPLLAQALIDTEPATDLDGRIMDAALELVEANGTRRTTIDEIAAAAGCGRATVFRRFGSKEAVLARLLVREMRRFLDEVGEIIATAPDPASSAVETFVATVRHAAEHPLLARVAVTEPQTFVEVARTGDPSLLELCRSFVARKIRAGQRRGVIPERDADQIADVLTRLSLSYVLMPGPLVDPSDPEQVRAFARTAIAPIVTG